jgi:tRNA threonylcarbamoyl adenosine modification protein YeaZ
MVDEILSTAAVKATELQRVAVTVGPGSFTGIRVGLAFCRALGLALDVPVVGISTLVAFAGPLLLELRSGVVASVVDARHGSVYFQVFASNGRPISPPGFAMIADAVRAAGTGPIRLTGSGAKAFAAEARRAGLQVDETACGRPLDIETVARLGAASDPKLSPAMPSYVKGPDAQHTLVAAIVSVKG